MKVKDFINGQFQGRHNNLIFYTRGNNTYVRRYAIPGKKRKWETEGRTPKQQAVAIRFKAVQVFYMTFAKQVSPEIWRALVRRHAVSGKERRRREGKGKEKAKKNGRSEERPFSR